MPEGGFPTPSAEPPSLQKNEWWMSNNSNSSSYPPNDDFKEISPQEVTPGSEGFVKALRLALDGNLTTLNDSSNNARTTPSVTEDKLEFASHRAPPRIPDLNREDKARVMKLVSELTQSQQERSQLKIRVEKMKRQTAAVVAEMTEYKLKLSQAVSQLQSCNGKIESLKTEKEEAREQLRRVQAVTSEVAETFTKERNVMHRERQALLTRYSTKEREVMQLRVRCENLKQALLRQKGIDMHQKGGLTEPVQGLSLSSLEFSGMGRGGVEERNKIEEGGDNNITEIGYQGTNHPIAKSLFHAETQSLPNLPPPKKRNFEATTTSGGTRSKEIFPSSSYPSATTATALGGGGVESMESSVRTEESYGEQWWTHSLVGPGHLKEQAKRLNAAVKSKLPELLPIEEVTTRSNQKFDPTLSLIQLVNELDASATDYEG